MSLGQIYGTGYEVILVAFSGIVTAQIIKFLLHLIIKRSMDLRLFTTTGGMPSSHSAGVMGLSTAVGLIKGFDSIEFAIALGYAFIVMYDAAGVRRAAGKQAACLNKMMEDFYHHDLQSVGGKLKELLGHTPFEVFVGAIFGICFAYLFHWFILK